MEQSSQQHQHRSLDEEFAVSHEVLKMSWQASNRERMAKVSFFVALMLGLLGMAMFSSHDASSVDSHPKTVPLSKHAAEVDLRDTDFTSCDDPESTSIHIDVDAQNVMFECGVSGKVEIIDGRMLKIEFGGEKVSFDKSKDMVYPHGSEKFHVGIIKMSTVLGAHGYDGLRHPSLMPLHYYALLLLQSGIVSNGLSQAVKGVTVGAISGESAFECNYPHIGGENDGYCGGKTCLESVCGDCCFHLACHSYQYCCDRCTAGQKALLGMNERCLGVPAWQLFAVTCDDRFPGWAYCQKECGDGEEAAAAYGYWQGGGAGGDAGAMEKMDIQEHVDDNEPAAEAEYYNELLKKESAKIYANIGDQDYKGFKSMLT